MKRIALLLTLAAASLSASLCHAADNLQLEQCLSREAAVDFVSRCLLAGGTSSTCKDGKPECCKKYADGDVICVSNPKGIVFEKLLKRAVPQTPSQPIERK